MKIYLIPGLGYDARIFGRLTLPDLELAYLDWIEPERNENIRSYVARLAAGIDAQDQPVVLIGHSFGAMIALEIAAIKKIRQVILISSIRSREELPFLFKLAGLLRLHAFLSKELFVKTVPYWGKQHGFASAAEQELFRSMVGGHTNNYLQWAFRSLSGWKTPVVPASTQVLQIHGAKDKTFPLKKTRNPDIVIADGSHIMVYKQPQKISRVILDGLLE